MRKLLPTIMLRDNPGLSIKDLGLDPGILDLDSGLLIFEYFPETSCNTYSKMGSTKTLFK